MGQIDETTGMEFFYWKGQKRFSCPITWEAGERCVFDHYDPRVVAQHAAEPHTISGKAPSRKITRVSPLVDGEGKPIIKEEEPVEPVEFKDYRFKPKPRVKSSTDELADTGV